MRCGEEGDLLSIGREITIAWKSSKEATRAIFDALPLLRRSRNVRLLIVLEDGVENADLALRAELQASLSRHGVEAEIESIPRLGRSELITSKKENFFLPLGARI